ncbi:NTE family protein [Noviherbaspirillum humi]|uniref:NTE family protein n=1 Tax=Noviherbaspirillum humi TaxID=1688639 RepID=A0A239LTN2_9BURK|nr:patatin-like phospholipase family protein [Noviherbaspirillum humi]SNT33153.1 NTE family protein [Noviherbaspirillum humi]
MSSLRLLKTFLVPLAAAILASCGSAPSLPSVSSVASAPPPAKVVRPVRIGLALGGGAARGFAHIGVIKALEAQGIVPDIVVGTSAGSVVGALYAAGNNGFALNKLALEMDEATISDWSVPLFAKATGVLKGEALQNYINRTIGNLPLEKMKIPFGAVAANLANGSAVLFQRGNTGQAVRASSAVPGVFQPVRIGEVQYVDGGLVSPVPVRFARQMGADFVIAVNISASPEAQPATSNTIDMLLQTFAIMGQTINQFELREADVVIQPRLGTMKGNDFPGRNTAILAGEQAAVAALPAIQQKLRQKREGA